MTNLNEETKKEELLSDKERLTDMVSQQKTEKSVLSITEAAEMSNVTRQAIYVAIKLKKLRANKENTRWTIHMNDLDDYRSHRYSRTRSIFQGELLFDNIRGYYSINQTADILNVPAQKIYYATRAGHIKGTRKGAAWVIQDQEIKRYREQYLNKKFKKKVG
jgi:excisionase family DNA binding protein